MTELHSLVCAKGFADVVVTVVRVPAAVVCPCVAVNGTCTPGGGGMAGSVLDISFRCTLLERAELPRLLVLSITEDN